MIHLLGSDDGMSDEQKLALAKAIYQLGQEGWDYFQATKEAKRQQGITRTLNQQALVGIATELWKLGQAQYPQLTMSDWLIFIQSGGNSTTIPGGNGKDKPEDNTNYWTYLAIFVILLVVTKK